MHAPPTDNFPEPRSYCACGHTGDGPQSQHAPIAFAHPNALRGEGAGQCTVRDCPCKRFTWTCFRPEYLRHNRPRNQPGACQ